jgi:hypothetical protein
MEGFNTEYILDKIAEMEDGVNSMSDIFKNGMAPEDTLKNAGLRIFDSVACVTDWIDVLMGLNDGDMEYEDCLKRLDEVIS